MIITPKITNKVVNKTTKISDYNLLAQNFLGINGKKNTLVLLMNNAEQRFGGGFVGTVGYVSSDGGKIIPAPFRGVYYYDWKFEEVNHTEIVNDPNPREALFNLRDGGQNLDWTKNAKRAKAIFEKEANKDVDNVIGVTPELLKYLIKKTGPVKLNDYNITVTESNITETIQQEVESGDDKVEGKDPKTILTSLMNVLLERLAQKNVKDLSDLILGMNELIKSRQILVYSPNYELSQILEKYKIDGSLLKFSGDYFLVSESNNSVDKSNAFIDRKIDRNIQIKDDGAVEITTKLTRSQTLPISFPYRDPHAPDIETYLIKANKSYIKIAIPAGSKILDSPESVKLEYKGKESGYDIYGFQSNLEPMVPSEYKFTYKLPFAVAGDPNVDFETLIQFANGGWPYNLSQKINFPSSWSFLASNRNDVKNDSKSTILDTNNVKGDVYIKQTYKK